MNSKTLVILIAASFLATAAALVALNQSKAATEDTIQVEAFWPNLKDTINDADKLVITTNDDQVTLAKDGDLWTVPQKEGYPASLENVRRLLLEISAIETIEPKTKNPDLFSKIDLVDPEDDAESNGVKIEVFDGSSALASFIAGKRKAAEFGSTVDPMLFVRKTDENQTWLAKGSISAKKPITQWMDNVLLSLTMGQVREAKLEFGDGEVVEISKQRPSDNLYDLKDMPEGFEFTYPSVTQGIVRPLNRMTLNDIVEPESIDFSSTETVKSTFLTFEGMTITAHVLDQDGKSYAKFDISYNEYDRYEFDEIDREREMAEKDTPTNTYKMNEPTEAAEEAERIKARLTGWVYEIPTYQARAMSQRKDAMIKEIAPPTEAAGATTIDPTSLGDLPPEIFDQLPPETQQQIRESLKAQQPSAAESVLPEMAAPITPPVSQVLEEAAAANPAPVVAPAPVAAEETQLAETEEIAEETTAPAPVKEETGDVADVPEETAEVAEEVAPIAEADAPTTSSANQ
jgi:hypothetical protein